VIQRTLITLILPMLAVGCGSSTHQSHDPVDMSSTDGAPTIEGQHGTLVDYFTSAPLSGFTVTDGTASTTTDAQGNWVLPAPMGVALAPMVTGPNYSKLYLPEAMAGSVDVNRGRIPLPDTGGFALEQDILSVDPSQAIVQITVVNAESCKSIAGGTLTVTSPAGASVAYFSTQRLPTASAFVDVQDNLPAAVVWNVPPGENVVAEIHHPTCTQAPAGTVHDGAIFTGRTKTLAMEPGDNTSALLFVLQ